MHGDLKFLRFWVVQSQGTHKSISYQCIKAGFTLYYNPYLAQKQKHKALGRCDFMVGRFPAWTVNNTIKTQEIGLVFSLEIFPPQLDLFTKSWSKFLVPFFFLFWPFFSCIKVFIHLHSVFYWLNNTVIVPLSHNSHILILSILIYSLCLLKSAWGSI